MPFGDRKEDKKGSLASLGVKKRKEREESVLGETLLRLGFQRMKQERE
jgi:hypothetical protein